MPNLTKSYVGLPLEPYLSPRIHRLLAQWQLLHDLVAGLGSPLNIVLHEEIVEAQNAFAEVRSRHGLRGRVLFARKANRSQALLRALVDSDAGIDVASLGELRDALAAGFTGPRIVAGGPKENAYLWLAVQSGATVFADSISELEALLALTRGAADRGDPVSVGVRLSGFSSIGVRVLSRPSRFGVNIRDLEAALDRITGSEGRLVLTLLGFHLDTTGTAERRTAIMALLGALEVAQQRGLDVRRLDIGGGWGTRYLKHEHQWHDYTAALHDAVLGY
ncbi:MAG: Y4yA family PLP-dependent enzyme, partial [Candidatus Dormibacteraceae bacterium]